MVLKKLKKMLQAILFDMDGVIVDTEPLHHKAYYKMFAKYQIPISNDLYESFTGQSTKNICKKLVSHFQLNVSAKELELSKRTFFNSLFDNDPSLKLLDGVLPLIKEYYSKGLTLVLASSASMSTINKVFNRFQLNPYFKAKLSGANFKASKPHPEIFLEAAKASGYNKSACMVIEDSTNGIRAAYDAGIFCVAYNSFHSKNQDYSLANKVITNFSEISFEKVQQWFANS